MSVIEAHGLHKRYGKAHVLQDIGITVDEGESAVLLGANGCGKSTLMRCLSGLERPDRGQIHVLGTNLHRARGARLRQARRRVGVVFQKFNLVRNLSVLQNVLYGASGRHKSFWRVMAPCAPRAEREYAMHCLDRVQLADRADTRADALSGGQQQRVAIARMLMQQPHLVLADEPVASLDPRSAREIMELLWTVTRQEGLTLICCLHQLDFASEYGERVLGMRNGQIVLDRPVAQTSRAELEALYEADAKPGEAARQPQLAVAS